MNKPNLQSSIVNQAGLFSFLKDMFGGSKKNTTPLPGTITVTPYSPAPEVLASQKGASGNIEQVSTGDEQNIGDQFSNPSSPIAEDQDLCRNVGFDISEFKVGGIYPPKFQKFLDTEFTKPDGTTGTIAGNIKLAIPVNSIEEWKDFIGLKKAVPTQFTDNLPAWNLIQEQFRIYAQHKGYTINAANNVMPAATALDTCTPAYCGFRTTIGTIKDGIIERHGFDVYSIPNHDSIGIDDNTMTQLCFAAGCGPPIWAAIRHYYSPNNNFITKWVGPGLNDYVSFGASSGYATNTKFGNKTCPGDTVTTDPAKVASDYITGNPATPHKATIECALPGTPAPASITRKYCCDNDPD